MHFSVFHWLVDNYRRRCSLSRFNNFQPCLPYLWSCWHNFSLHVSDPFYVYDSCCHLSFLNFSVLYFVCVLIFNVIYNTGSILCLTPRCEVMHTPMGAWALEVQEFGFSSALFWVLYLYLPPAGFYLLTLFLMVRIIPLCFHCLLKLFPLQSKSPSIPVLDSFCKTFSFSWHHCSLSLEDLKICGVEF
jgi:hypothetical protein